MITVVVEFKLPESVACDHIKEMFSNIAAMYYDIPGLIRKYFLLSEDGKTVGGVYLWQSRKDAECFYTENFKLSIVEHFGSEPSIKYFETPVIVDNLMGETITSGRGTAHLSQPSEQDELFIFSSVI